MFLVAHASYMILLGAPEAQRGRNRRARGRAQGSAGEDRAPLVHGADVPLGDGGVDVHAARSRRSCRSSACKFAWVEWHWIAGLVLTGVDHLPHHSRHVLPRLLVDLGRAERHPGIQGRDDARAGPRRAGPEVGQVSARQPPLPPRDPGRRPVGVDHRAVHDVARAARRSSRATRTSSATRRGASPTCCTASPASRWSAWSSRTSTSRSGPRSGGSRRR